MIPIPLPPWNKNNYDTFDGQMFYEYAEFLNSPQTYTSSTFGTLAGTASKYQTGAVAANGKMYCPPFAVNECLEIDPVAETVTTFGSIAGSNKYQSSSLAPNGNIYCAPATATNVCKIDPTGPSATTFGSVAAGTFKYAGSVLVTGGIIYAVPRNATAVLKIDTNSDTVSTFGSLAGSDKWFGGCLAKNGFIYCAPFTATSVLKINPATDTTSTFGSVGAGTNKWRSIVEAPNGNLYCTPQNATSILKINPNTDAISTFGSITSNIYRGGSMDMNGKIYFFGDTTSTVVIVDTATDTVSTQSISYDGSTVGPGFRGYIVGVPIDATNIVKLLTEDNLDRDFALSRQYNKT